MDNNIDKEMNNQNNDVFTNNVIVDDKVNNINTDGVKVVNDTVVSGNVDNKVNVEINPILLYG